MYWKLPWASHSAGLAERIKRVCERLCRGVEGHMLQGEGVCVCVWGASARRAQVVTATPDECILRNKGNGMRCIAARGIAACCMRDARCCIAARKTLHAARTCTFAVGGSVGVRGTPRNHDCTVTPSRLGQLRGFSVHPCCMAASDVLKYSACCARPGRPGTYGLCCDRGGRSAKRAIS